MPFVPASTRRLLLSVTAACVLAAPAQAKPGDHVRVGATEIVPAVTAGVEGHTNAYRAPADRKVAAFSLYLSPSLRIMTRAKKVWFDLDGVYELRKFVHPIEATNLDQFSNFRLGAALQVLPEGVVGFDIGDRAVLINRAADREFRSNALISQFRNDAAVAIPIRPGPELEIKPGFDYGYHDYRIPGVYAQVAFDTKHVLTPGLDLTWKFFPNTAFVIDTSVELNRWSDNTVDTNRQDVGTSPTAEVGPYGRFIALPDSLLFKGVAGVRGRFSRIFLLDVLVGYGIGRFDTQSVIDDAPADAGVEADPVATGFDQNVSALDGLLVLVKPVLDLGYLKERKLGQRLTVLYQKDFQTSFFTNYVHAHHIYGGLESRWGRWMRTQVGGGVRFEDYYGELNRQDRFTAVNGALDFLPTRALSIRLGVDWTHRDSTEKAVEFDNVTGRVLLSFVY